MTILAGQSVPSSHARGQRFEPRRRQYFKLLLDPGDFHSDPRGLLSFHKSETVLWTIAKILLLLLIGSRSPWFYLFLKQKLVQCPCPNTVQFYLSLIFTIRKCTVFIVRNCSLHTSVSQIIELILCPKLNLHTPRLLLYFFNRHDAALSKSAKIILSKSIF